MRIAYYAPMKAPDDPVPSGDRNMARLVARALVAAGHEPWLASRLRTLDLGGDTVRQRVLARASLAEAEAILAGLGTLSRVEQPAAWLTYHVYYKAPDWIGPAVARALGIPYLVVEGSRAPKRARGPYAFAHEAAEAALDQASVIFYMTGKDFELLERLKPPGQALIRLPPFLDGDSWPPRGRPPREAAFRLLTVAMMRLGDKLASYRLLAEALAHLGERPWSLDLVGDGPARPQVGRAFEPFGSRVRFHGARPAEELVDFYAAADLFVWPAVNEAYGMVFLEAQAYGVPPVAGHFGGTADVIRHGETGLLVAPGDARALAAGVIELMDDEERRRELCDRARRFVREERTLSRAADLLAQGLEVAGAAARASPTPGREGGT